MKTCAGIEQTAHMCILLCLVCPALARAQSIVPGRAVSPPVTQPQDPGDEPLADICIVGGPPDSGFKLSVPATSAMLDAAEARALRRELLPEDGIGVGIGPDGTVHIIYSDSVHIRADYGPLVSWDLWYRLEQNALGGPTFTSLTYQQQRINELFNKAKDIQQRWENGIYWTGQMGQMLVLGKAGAASRALPGPVAGSGPTIHSIVPPLTPPTAKTTRPPVTATPPAATTTRTPAKRRRHVVNAESGALFPKGPRERRHHMAVVKDGLREFPPSRFPASSQSFRNMRANDVTATSLTANMDGGNMIIRWDLGLIANNAQVVPRTHAISGEIKSVHPHVYLIVYQGVLSRSQGSELANYPQLDAKPIVWSYVPPGLQPWSWKVKYFQSTPGSGPVFD